MAVLMPDLRYSVFTRNENGEKYNETVQLFMFQWKHHQAIFVFASIRKTSRIFCHVLGLRMRNSKTDKICACTSGIFTGSNDLIFCPLTE
jgi:hypothetical protein